MNKLFRGEYELQKKVTISNKSYSLYKSVNTKNFVVYCKYGKLSLSMGSGKTEDEAIKAATKYISEMNNRKEEVIYISSESYL